MPTLRANGIDIYYETAGQGDPLLLLHGLGSRSDDWAMQFPVFSERFRVLAPDVRGHGQTDKPSGPYNVPMMAEDIACFLDVLEIKSVHIVGLSMGGMIAFQLAVDRPELVRSLVIVNSAPALVPRTLGERLRVAQRYWLARLFGPARTGKFLGRRLFPKPEQALYRDRLIAQWRENDPKAYLAAMRALIGWSVLDRVSGIRCPTLVISGDRDYTPAAAKQEYTALIPGGRVVIISDSGHATPIDQAEQFNACVLDFLYTQKS